MINNGTIGAIAPPPCRRQIALFPVRYAIMPSAEGGYHYPAESALKQDFPLLDQSLYCLRSLRQGGYVYLYDEFAPYPWSCFYYGEAPTIGFYQVQIALATGKLTLARRPQRKSCIVIDNHEHNPQSVELCYSDTPLSAETLKRLEESTQRKKVMQTLKIGVWHEQAKNYWDTHKQALTKDNIPEVPDAFHVEDILDYVIDYSKYSSYEQEKHTVEWSEEAPENNIHPVDAMTHSKNISSTHLCFALHDAVGIASELSHLVGYEVAKLNQFVDNNARKVQAMSSIKTLTNKAGRRASQEYNHINAVDSALFNSGAISGVPLNKAHKDLQVRKEAAKRLKQGEFNRYIQLDAFNTFDKDYPKQLDAHKNNLELAGKDHVIWLENLNQGGLYVNLSIYDAKDSVSYIGLREAVARSTMALPASIIGTNYGAKQFTENEAIGIFHEALHGNPHIKEYVEKTKTLGFVVAEGAADKIAALTATLAEIPADNASKTLSGIAIALLTSSQKITRLQRFESSRYPAGLEAMEGVFSGKKSLKLNEFVDQMKQELGTKKTTQQFQYSTSTQVLNQKVTIPFTLEVPVERSRYEKQQEQTLLKKTAFWSNIKIGASSLGLFLGTYGTLNALEALKTDDKHILVNSLGLSSNLFALGAATSGMTQVLYEKRGALTNIDANKKAFKLIEDIADKTALLLLIGAAIMGGVKTFIMLLNTSERRRTAYAGAFVAHASVTTIGTYHLLTKVAQTSPKAAQAVTAINATRIGKVLSRINPYAGIAILVGEAIAFGLEKYAEAQAEEKVVNWVKQSIWGVTPNKAWNASQEQYLLHNLFIAPKITTDFKFFAGENQLTVILPAYRPQVSAFEIIDDGKNISDKAEVRITPQGAILHAKDIDWIGQVSVSYWPDKFTQPEISYKATD